MKLLRYLESKGCGYNFLNALQASMKMTGVIGSATFNTANGMKQGGSTSCNLFTPYMDDPIAAINSTGPHDWLGELHSLWFMDDAAVIATTREKLTEKIAALKRSTDAIDMIIHPQKSQYVSINSEEKQPMKIDDVTISHTESYTYLGAKISNNNIATQMKDHLQEKAVHTRNSSQETQIARSKIRRRCGRVGSIQRYSTLVRPGSPLIYARPTLSRRTH